MVGRYLFIILIGPLTSLGQGDRRLSADELYDAGEAALRKRQYETALHYYDQCIHLDALHADAYFSRAVVKEKLLDQNGALVDYTLAYEIQPRHYEALLGRAMLRYSERQWSLARDDFRSLLVMNTGQTSAVYYKTDEVGRLREIVTAQSSDKGYLYNYLGLIETQLAEYEQALQYFDSAFAAGKDPKYLINKGVCLQTSGDTAASKLVLEEVLKMDPENATARHNLGAIALHEGNAELAINQLNMAIANNPDLPYPYAERGYYKLMHDDLQGAIEDYTWAIERDDKDSDLRLNRGIAHEKAGHIEKAFADYTQALQLDDLSAKAWFNRANLWYQLKNFEEAIKDYEIAIVLDPDYMLAYYNRGLTFRMMGRNAEACRDLERAKDLGYEPDPGLLMKVCHDQ